jgi:hypothetical protein
LAATSNNQFTVIIRMAAVVVVSIAVLPGGFSFLER